jgi:hypothetical protein
MVLLLGKDGAALQFADDRHASDEILEQYAMNRLTGPQLADFEEHLLVCVSCQDRLAREDNIRQQIRDAGTELESTTPAAQGRYRRLSWAIGLAAAALLILAGVAWQGSLRSIAPPATILLQTVRGVDNQSPVAPAGSPLVLVLDLTGLPQLPSYKLEIVDAAGHPVIESDGVPRGNKLQTAVAKGLASGAYFVRLYNPSRELLREFVLNVRG